MSDHAAQTILAEATGHARAGRYDDARRALADLADLGEDAEALDLLARIHTQQGDLAAADDCWARVQALDTGHTGASEGRRRIHRIWSGTRNGSARSIGVGVAVLILVGAGAVAGQALMSEPEDRPADQGVADELDRLAGAVDALEPEAAPETESTEDTEAALQTAQQALVDPRWTAEIQGRSIAVTFDDSLFPDGGTDLPDSGDDLLADAAARIGSLEGASVTVVGHTNDIPTGDGSRYEDNTELGLARALAAAESLAAAGELQLPEIHIATSGDDDPPYPNNTEADRRRNQTVTLTVTLA
ncbi:OmpA family protein [Glycomyces buryatensis]|uniref:OmpA-like domain-containing protein n=1 Tax=Glycomyces buryatensis TaxID=2570927 RepID=A0A4S8QK98_9ACTN|nr:OmpA family protein [Glycomyces buryatensis]THV43415.1 hypothetical protein FAB82_01705 [Glycomyces buryatensis]